MPDEGRHANRRSLETLVADLASAARAGRLLLVGATSQLMEGWVSGVPRLLMAADGAVGAVAALRKSAVDAARARAIGLDWESPAEVIPLPRGAAARHRPIPTSDGVPGAFSLAHYDPYSVICRGLVRGDEQDYHTALRYLRHGWANEAELMSLATELLPRFTHETIAQDPAEFRRKLKGLVQMWRAAS